MPSDDDRINAIHDGNLSRAVKKGTGPREAPPKAWPSNKPPGGKLPSKGAESGKGS